jgi:hypothetical protein
MLFKLLEHIVKDQMLVVSLNESPNIHMAKGQIIYSKRTALKPPTHERVLRIFLFGRVHNAFGMIEIGKRERKRNLYLLASSGANA